MTRYFILLITLAITNCHLVFSLETRKPEKGLLDLRDAAIHPEFIIKLNGQWEFYWKKLYRPYNFRGGNPPRPDGYIKVPSYWTDADIPGIETEGTGFATYRLVVLLPENSNLALGLDVKVFDSSYDLYINGVFSGSNGITGSSEETSVPGYEPRIYRFQAVNDTVEIIFNVSNFNHRRGGFWLPVELGSFAKIQNVAARRFGQAWSNVGILAAFALFFLFFHLLYRKDKTSLFFAIALIGLALRPLFTNQYLSYLFMQPGWEWTIKMEYLSLFTAVAGGFLFLNSVYPHAYHRFAAYLAVISFAIMATGTILLPVKVFSYFTLPTYILIVLFAFNIISSAVISLIRKRRFIDWVYLCGFAILVYSVGHDVLMAASNRSGHGGYIVSDAILAFIFIQSGLLIFKWVGSFREKERLQNNLELLNKDLESIVDDRTRELLEAKNTAEEYSRQIEIQNKNLTETINLKNKVFSVIAHDLRSPVVNIQYILNLLKEDEYREKYETLAGSCINYSQMVINLLENMLVWGRGQEDRIRYAPAMHDVSGIILTNMSIYKDTADRKEIAVNFIQVGGTMAWIDRELVDIIVRNLLSNAIKFTNRGGRVSILLKEKTKPSKELILRICDNGIGITPERQKSIFSAGELESTPGTENEKGTGFGLKLSNELAIVNKGTLSLESTPGQGTCFTITLPGDPG